ncbi:MAG: 1-(5-phosphoribosyl)-5-[(5-phosphoribosylamino)methylideneamino]imidazole-4-carboxamide isomerase [Buchnera aphidicola (Nurudea yanoniella)]
MIIPSIDIINGTIVRLYQGKYHRKTTYKDKIYDIFSNHHLKGANFIHLVDLDGASDPKKKQINVIKDILSYSKVNLQVGGGIRNSEDLKILFSLGVKRVVIGSSAVYAPEKVRFWLKKYGGERIVLALDVRIIDNTREIIINAWKKTSGISIEELIDKFFCSGLKHVLCTDTSRDGTLLGPNIDLYADLSKSFKDIYFQASGGIGSLNDIILLRKSGVKSVIIGRALLEKKIDLAEAIKCWQNG